MARQVWFLELEQRVGTKTYQVRTSSDGMVSEYLIEDIETGKLDRERFNGETSVHQAERRFMDDVIRVVHGG